MDTNSITLIKNILINCATNRTKVRYVDIEHKINESSGLIKTMLASIAIESMDKYGCLLTAIVVEPDGSPMNGFFNFATQVGAMNETDDRGTFWLDEVEKVYERFSSVVTTTMGNIGEIVVGDKHIGIRSISLDITGGPDLIVIELDIPNPFKHTREGAYLSLRSIAPRGEGHRYVEKFFGPGSVTKIIDTVEDAK